MKNKTKIITGGVIGVTCLISLLVAGITLPKDDYEPILREYPVTRGTLTAGVDGAGIIEAQKLEQRAKAPLKVSEIQVEKGQSVKKGDVLVSFSTEEITKQLTDLELQLKRANTSLQQAINAKKTSDLQHKNTINQMKETSESQYNKIHRDALAQVTSLEQQLQTVNDEIAQLNIQIEELTTQLETPPIEGEGEVDKSLIQTQINELVTMREGLQSQLDEVTQQLEVAKQQLSQIESDRKEELKQEQENEQQQNELHQLTMSDLNQSIKLSEEDVSKLQTDISELKEQLKHTSIKASHDGIVHELNVNVGDTVTEDLVVVTLANLGEITAKILVSQEDINKVEVEQEVELTLAAYPDETVMGKVVQKELTPTSGQNGAGYFVYVQVETTELKILEGMNCQVQFILKQVEDVLVLSNKAIVLKDGKQVVNVKHEDETIEEVQIVTGFSDGRQTEIISGLEEGDIVVMEG